MSVIVESEKVLLSERKEIKESSLKVECKSSIPTEQIKKIIFITAKPFTVKEQAEEKSVKIVGKVRFYIAYENQEGEIKKCECEKEFNGELNDLALPSSPQVCALVAVEKTQADLAGMHLNAIAYLKLTAEITEKKEVEYLTGGELISDGKEVEIERGIGQKTTVYAVEEEFEVAYAIEEVLYQGAECVVFDCQCGVSNVIVDGRVYLTQILLQSGEKKDIIKERREIPFRAEIDIDEAMPTNSACAWAVVRAFKTDITVDQEQKRSKIEWKVSLTLKGECYREEQITLVRDAFSLDKEIELVKERAVWTVGKPCNVIEEKFVGKANIEELPVGASLCVIVDERAEITATEPTEKGVSVAGIVCGTALFFDGDGNIFSRKIESPFMTLLNVEIGGNEVYSVSAIALSMEMRVVSLNGGEVYADLIYSVNACEKKEFTYIKEVVEKGDKQKETVAISVYIPEKDEELFALAKRLNVHPNELVLTNSELQFPLTGEERIVVYRQK